MSQITFSEIVSALDGNGFTNYEAIHLSTKIMNLADRNELWLQGVAMQVEKKGEFNDFKPQNLWQHVFVKKFTRLSPKERQCYVMNQVQRYSIRKISDKLDISQWTVRMKLEVAEDKLLPNRPYTISKDMLNGLPERCRFIYLLRVRYEMTYKEICEELGVTQVVIRTNLRKAERYFLQLLNNDKRGLSYSSL